MQLVYPPEIQFARQGRRSSPRYKYFHQLLFTSLLSLFACTKDGSVDPVSADHLTKQQTRLDIPAIDPDQKAYPKEVEIASNQSPNQPAVVPIPTVPSVNTESVALSEVTRPASSMPPTAVVSQPTADSAPVATSKETTSNSADEGVDHVESGSMSKQGSGPQTFFIKAAILTIRSQPNRHSKIIGYLKGGTEVHVKTNGDWCQLDAGRWIRTRWLVKTGK